MKTIKINFLAIIMAFAFISFYACNSKQGAKQENEKEQVEKGKEYTSKYICPMHCEGSGSNEPGTCPVCKMDYVLNKDHAHQGHDHEEDNHDEHDHEEDNHEGHDHDHHDHEGHGH